MKKAISTLALGLLMAAVLSACGGGGSSSSDAAAGGGNPSGGGTSGGGGAGSGGSSLCAGAAWQTPNFDVYASGSASPTRRVATYYGASMGAASQCIAIASTLQITTTDSFGNVAWYDAAGAALSGGAADKFNENALLSCTSGSGATGYLAVRADTGASVFNGTQAALLVGNATPFLSEECNSAGTGIDNGLTRLSFGIDKSVTVQDTTSGGSSTTFTAAQVQQAFGAAGLTLGDGTVIRWTLYVVPVASGLTKQVIVHTGTKTNGTVNVLAFLQS